MFEMKKNWMENTKWKGKIKYKLSTLKTYTPTKNTKYLVRVGDTKWDLRSSSPCHTPEATWRDFSPGVWPTGTKDRSQLGLKASSSLVLSYPCSSYPNPQNHIIYATLCKTRLTRSSPNHIASPDTRNIVHRSSTTNLYYKLLKT